MCEKSATCIKSMVPGKARRVSGSLGQVTDPRLCRSTASFEHTGSLTRLPDTVIFSPVRRLRRRHSANSRATIPYHTVVKQGKAYNMYHVPIPRGAGDSSRFVAPSATGNRSPNVYDAKEREREREGKKDIRGNSTSAVQTAHQSARA